MITQLTRYKASKDIYTVMQASRVKAFVPFTRLLHHDAGGAKKIRDATCCQDADVQLACKILHALSGSSKHTLPACKQATHAQNTRVAQLVIRSQPGTCIA